MDVNLPQEQLEFIEQLIASGRFSSFDEALTECVRALASTDRLRSEIAAGIDSAEAEDLVGHDVLFAELRSVATAAQARRTRQ